MMLWKRKLTPSQRFVNAVASQNLDGVRDALAAGADPNARDRAERPALVIAASAKWAAGVAAILQAGGDVHIRFTDEDDGLNDSPLINFPAANGSVETLEVVLRAGAEPDSVDRTGLTPLMCAAFMDRAMVAERLIKAGASIEARDEKGYTALMFAAN